MLAVIRSALFSPVRLALRLVGPLIFRLNRQTTVHGIALVDLTPLVKGYTPPPTFVQKFSEALQLVADYDPRRLKRIQRDLKRIMLLPEAAGYYDHSLRAYWTDLRVLAQPVWRIATFIVHEATHARLGTAGVRYGRGTGGTREEWERRVETLCVHEEIAFAHRFTDSKEVFEYLEKTLDTEWWSDEKDRHRWLRRMRGAKVPELLIRAAAWLPPKRHE